VSEEEGRVHSLVSRVSLFLRQYAKPRRHHIACGLGLADGLVIIAANVVSNYGPASVCAEQVALGQYLTCSTTAIAAVVSLRATFQDDQPLEIVPPCGRCRELLYEYAGNSKVVLSPSGRADTKGLELCRIADLMPHPFARRHCPAGTSG
jgi:cytidine deaminase